MKLLTFAIPCYNSQEYMGKCIESLLPGGDEVEILIIDDGSTDLTADIADKYEEKYPGIVRAIHQANGGHGEAVNTGIRNASGLYFKVVDSDDWVDKDAYRQVLDKLRELTGGDTVLDMMLCNFVYDKDGAKRKKVMHYENSVPVEELVSWEDTKHFRKGRYILMHSVIYRTRLLRKCGIELPKHTFYVDNIYVFEPLPYVKTIYYLPVNFYRYYIGREDQSVNESVMISRIDQQITVTKLMIDYFRDTKGGGSGISVEEEAAVGIPEVQRYPDVLRDKAQHAGTEHEPAREGRPQDSHRRLQDSTDAGRLQLVPVL